MEVEELNSGWTQPYPTLARSACTSTSGPALSTDAAEDLYLSRRTIRSAAPSPESRSENHLFSVPLRLQRITNTSSQPRSSFAEVPVIDLTHSHPTGQVVGSLSPVQGSYVSTTGQGAATMSSALVTSDQDEQIDHELNDNDEGGLFGDGDEDNFSGYDKMKSITVSLS